MALRCVAPVGDRCGEAATWDANNALLYWADVNRFLIHRLDHQGAVRSWFFDEPVVALSLTDQPGVLLAALGSRLILWRPADDHRTDFGFSCSGWPKVRFNDGRAGPRGDFWIGSMANNVGRCGENGEIIGRLGELRRLETGAQPCLIRSEIGISNTVCWSPDHRRFYFGDSIRNLIWVHDHDLASGEITGERTFLEGFERGAPDGSSVDADGALWNCRYGGGCVVRVTADGRIDRVIEMPVANITTCAFGGPDLKTLYITTAQGDRAEERLAGSLFALDVEIPGAPAHAVRLETR